MKRRALLIGTGDYERSEYTNLQSPKADLDALERALKRNGEFEIPKVLTNPSYQEALTAIEDILSDGGPKDLALISISGHGVKNKFGRLHLAMRDTRPDRLRSTAVPAEMLHRMLEESRISSKVLLLDCCYSGAFADGFSTRGDGDDAIDFEREIQGQGTYVLAASGALEVAYEGDNGTAAEPSPFSLAVAQGLGGAARDSNGDGWIDTQDLYQYVHRQVDSLGRQKVTGFASGMQGSVRLVRQVKSLTATSVDDDPTRRTAHADGARAASAESAGDGASGSITATAESAHRFIDARAPFDVRQWKALFSYYRSCLSRQSVLQQLPDAGGKQYAVCDMGKEALLSGHAERWTPTGGAAAIVSTAAREGAELRYGYPAVLFDTGPGAGRGRRNWKVAPLFVMDVDAVVDGDGFHIAPVGEPELNTEVLATIGALNPDEISELTTWFDADWGNKGHAGLGDKARAVCERLDLDRVHPLVPGELREDLDLAKPYRSGAQNTAVLFAADKAAAAVKQLVTDLDVDGKWSLKPGDISKTALAALSGEANGEGDGRPTRPVITGHSNAAQEEVLHSAMTRTLTVATGAPGTGKSELITSLVTTALGAGDSVLVASTNNTAVDEVVGRANKLIPGADLVVRTGNAAQRAREEQILSTLRSVRFDQVDTATLADRLVHHQRRLAEADAALAAVAKSEHRLAVLAPLRRSVVNELPGWIGPERLGEVGAARRLLNRIEKVLDGHWAIRWHRWRLSRELGRVASESELSAIARFLDTEDEWQEALVERRNAPDPAEAHAAIAELRERRRSDSSSYVVGRTAQFLASGGQYIDARIQAISAGNGGWKGLARLLAAVPAWATTSRSARAFPPNAGLFDLVIIDEASQCTVADLVPLMYRAKRALVIGDPNQLQPVNNLDYREDQRLQGEAGLSEEWLDDRSLLFSRSSAYHAAASALASMGGDVLWLDEHYRCHPDIVAPANRRFYGDRLAIRTRTHSLTAATEPALQWIDVQGSPDRPGGFSCRNRDEAARVIELLRELWRDLPEEATIGVATPFAGQLREIDRRLGDRAGERIRTGTVHTFQGGECDVIVLSPAAATGVDRRPGAWATRQQNLWNVAITRAKSRLYVVGDKSYWEAQTGVLSDIASRTDGGDGLDLDHDEARSALFSALSDARIEPIVGARIGGYRCDLKFHTDRGTTAVLVDWSGSHDPSSPGPGRSLYRVLDRAALFREVSGIPAVRVPAWRCLVEPDLVAAELIGGR